MKATIVAALLVSGFSLLAAGGELTFQPVALTGQPAPGLTNNIRFSGFDYVSLADDGRIAFTAKVSGPGVNFTNNLGLWAGLPGNLTFLVRTGEPVPGTNNGPSFTHLKAPNIDNHEAVAFLAAESNDTPNYAENMWIGLLSGGRASGVSQTSFAQGLNIYLGFTAVNGYVVNVVGGRAELFGPGIGPTNDQAIVVGPPTNIVIVAQKGSTAPGTAGNFTFFDPDNSHFALTPDGNLAFMAEVADGPATRVRGIWFGKAGSVQAVMLPNRPAPASLLGPGHTFGAPSSENVEVNARGELAFATYLLGPGLNNTNSEFVVAGKPGNFRVIAQMGQPAPGIPGAFFRRFTGGFTAFSNALLSDDGTVAFVGCYSTSGTEFGLWLAPTNGATPILLMRSGQQAPGAPAGAVFTNSFPYLPPFEEAFMNSRNQITFRALVSGPDAGPNYYGIWLTDPDGNVHLITRTGDVMEVGGVMKQVSSVTFGIDPESIAGPEDGRRMPFNDRGEIALLIRFTDFSSGLFMARTGIVLSGERVGNDIRITFPSVSNKTYRVEFTTNLPATSWSAFGSSVTGTGGDVSVTDTNAASLARRFYRAVRLD